jgi:hypothetical protein
MDERYEMTALAEKKVYIQRDWTDQELIADGFLSYRPVKRITMARMLPMEEAPKTIKTSGNTFTVQAGYWIAYKAGHRLKETLDDYEPQPIDPDIFAAAYRLWDEPDEYLTATQAQLQRLGCKPYYKIVGVWAKQLVIETWVQSMESVEPSLAPKEAWLCVGIEGEPWIMTDTWFQANYRIERPIRSESKELPSSG